MRIIQCVGSTHIWFHRCDMRLPDGAFPLLSWCRSMWTRTTNTEQVLLSRTFFLLYQCPKQPVGNTHYWCVILFNICLINIHSYLMELYFGWMGILSHGSCMTGCLSFIQTEIFQQLLRWFIRKCVQYRKPHGKSLLTLVIPWVLHYSSCNIL